MEINPNCQTQTNAMNVLFTNIIYMFQNFFMAFAISDVKLNN